jgi:hypothetical protein
VEEWKERREETAKRRCLGEVLDDRVGEVGGVALAAHVGSADLTVGDGLVDSGGDLSVEKRRKSIGRSVFVQRRTAR